MRYDSLFTLCDLYSIEEVKTNYLRLMSYFTESPDISLDLFLKAMTEIEINGHIEIAYTLEDGKLFIHGAATIFYETKLSHGCKKVGHIDDVVVSPNYRDQGIGVTLVNRLKRCAATTCYKITVNCKEDHIPFFEKCSLFQNGIHMRHYF
jgi:glucosamine-phosphate N-acetyltransferase